MELANSLEHQNKENTESNLTFTQRTVSDFIKSVLTAHSRIDTKNMILIPKRPCQLEEFPLFLSKNITNCLVETKGIHQLYSHQANALNTLFNDNQSVILTTSTR